MSTNYMEHLVRVVRHLLIWSLIALCFAAATILLKTATSRYAAALDDRAGSGAPSYVHAGVPFVVHDHYATQVCVSSFAGKPLPPFVTPPDQYRGMILEDTRVQAWMPFTVRDGPGTLFCVSSRGGEVYRPFVMP